MLLYMYKSAAFHPIFSFFLFLIKQITLYLLQLFAAVLINTKSMADSHLIRQEVQDSLEEVLIVLDNKVIWLHCIFKSNIDSNFTKSKS
jgi:hypothetical protein